MELVETSDSEPNAFSGPTEVPIPGDEDDLRVAKFERGCEVDGVVAAQAQIFGILAGASRELPIDANGS